MIRAVMLATGPDVDKWVRPCVAQWCDVIHVEHLPKTLIMRYPRVRVTFRAQDREEAERVAGSVSAYMGMSLGRTKIIEMAEWVQDV